jgi:hypothetical protein
MRLDPAFGQEVKTLTTILQTGGREVRISVVDKGLICEIEVSLPKYELLQINPVAWVLCRPKQLEAPLALVFRHAAARLLTEEEQRYWKLWRTLQL